MIDILEQLAAVHRKVYRTEEAVGVLMQRTYQAQVEEVWDALTDTERLSRWLWPTTGDLRVGGQFQLKDMAGGEVLECEPPKRFKVTYGGDTSLVEVRLSPGPEQTTEFELEHTVPSSMGPGAGGALYVGPGWDGALLGLHLWVVGEVRDDFDPVAVADSPEVIAFNERAVHIWLEVVRESGTTTPEDLEAAAAVAMAQYAPDAPRDNLS